jgi:predicted DNA-binding WGR domain protein
MSTVTATTVTNTQAGHNKFYRTYVVGKIAVNQYGRIDTVGQWSGQRYSSGQAADNAARDKVSDKIRGGYRNRHVETFEFDDSTLQIADRDSLKRLHFALIHGAGTTPAPAPAAPKPVPAPAPPVLPDPDPEPDRYAAFTSRALGAVTLAVTDPTAAMVELALLREQWEELEQVHERAASYLDTLNTMLLAEAFT